jgi:hypothetical protein
MRHIDDPKQSRLFDPFANVFSELAYERIRTGWQGVFRFAILELLPAQQLGEHFHPDLGRPTKELYSMAGLILIQEFKNWTRAEAVDAYLYNSDVQYALNLEPGMQSLSERTLERYERLFREDELAGQVMQDVTVRLAKLLELHIDQQRLDSTHVFSNMASFGRTRLMGVAIKRFLTQVKRHAVASYELLPEELRRRYAPSEHQLFGKSGTDAEKRSVLQQQVAEDMYFLVERFADDAAMAKRSSYRSMALIFQQQCAVELGKVTIQAKPGGNCMQNPSDPDATYDGKKGQGYQVQIAETCNPANEVQLITAALPETAATSDVQAVAPVLAELTAAELKPTSMLADTAYGSDENVQLAAAQGVELVSPVSGTKVDDPYQLNADDFAVNEATGRVERCPAGELPMVSAHNAETGKTTATMPHATCVGCPFREECPVEPTAKGYRVTFDAKERRLEERRREEATEPFRERYSRRSGIESTNSGLKRRLGMGKLRVRGSPSVFQSLVLKIAGWNVLRSAVSEKLRAWVGEKMAAARRGGCLARVGPLWGALAGRVWPAVARRRYLGRSGMYHALRAAA